MGVLETAIFYLVIGAAIAFSSLLIEREQTHAKRAALFAGTLIFWPAFAPFLFNRVTARPKDAELAPAPRAPETANDSPLDRRIASTEAELLASMERLHGVAETVLAPELARVRKLAVALHGMAKRLAEMDRLLETPEFSAARAEALLAELEAKVKDRDDARLLSVRARMRNIERVRAMRVKTADELERAIFKMEEMSSQMIVLELAGGAEAEVVESMRELALSIDAAVETSLAVA